MSKKSSERRVKELAEQYKNDMKKLIREKKLDHKSLESNLSGVLDQMNEEMRKLTVDLIAEEQEEKKTARAPVVDKKQE